MTYYFFPHIVAIDMYKISQGKKKLEKSGICPSCGFFQHFLAPFDTFATRYDHSGIKFEFLAIFIFINTLLKNYF